MTFWDFLRTISSLNCTQFISCVKCMQIFSLRFHTRPNFWKGAASSGAYWTGISVFMENWLSSAGTGVESSRCLSSRLESFSLRASGNSQPSAGGGEASRGQDSSDVIVPLNRGSYWERWDKTCAHHKRVQFRWSCDLLLCQICVEVNYRSEIFVRVNYVILMYILVHCWHIHTP